MKKINYIFLLLIVFLLDACQQPKEDLTIPDAKLKEIIKDLHLAEEITQRFRDYDKDSVRALFWKDISEVHDLDTSEINFNLDVLKNNPEKAFKLYEEIYDEMNREYLQRENKVNKQFPKK